MSSRFYGLTLAALMTSSAHGNINPNPVHTEAAPQKKEIPVVTVTSTGVTLPDNAITIDYRIDKMRGLMQAEFNLFGYKTLQVLPCSDVVKADETLDDPTRREDLAKRLEEGSRREFRDYLTHDAIAIRNVGPIDQSKSLGFVEDAVAQAYTQLKINVLRETAPHCAAR